MANLYRLSILLLIIAIAFSNNANAAADLPSAYAECQTKLVYYPGGTCQRRDNINVLRYCVIAANGGQAICVGATLPCQDSNQTYSDTTYQCTAPNCESPLYKHPDGSCQASVPDCDGGQSATGVYYNTTTQQCEDPSGNGEDETCAPNHNGQELNWCPVNSSCMPLDYKCAGAGPGTQPQNKEPCGEGTQSGYVNGHHACYNRTDPEKKNDEKEQATKAAADAKAASDAAAAANAQAQTDATQAAVEAAQAAANAAAAAAAAAADPTDSTKASAAAAAAAAATEAQAHADALAQTASSAQAAADAAKAASDAAQAELDALDEIAKETTLKGAQESLKAIEEHFKNKNATAGDSACNAPPTCEGDAIECAINQQLYDNRCAFQKEHEVDTSGLEQFESQDQSSADNITTISEVTSTTDVQGLFNSFNINRFSTTEQCIGESSFEYDGKTYDIDFSIVCQIGIFVRMLMLMVAYVFAIRTIMGAVK